MKALKIGLLVVVGLVVVLAGIGFLLPAKWSVERSIVVNAPPTAIYPFVANMKTGWPQWSPFDKEDPEMTYTYAGPEEGLGASRAWVSKKMGDGSMKVTKADPNTGIEYELEMVANHFTMTGKLGFEPSGAGTKVVWLDTGEVGANPMHRWMANLMDKMMGGMFERGLQTLKSKAEAAAAAAPSSPAPSQPAAPKKP